jgi:hypothetical protein
MIGEKMAVRFTAKNAGSKERKIPILVLSASPQVYTGHHTKIFHRKFFSDQVLAGNEGSMRLFSIFNIVQSLQESVYFLIITYQSYLFRASLSFIKNQLQFYL